MGFDPIRPSATRLRPARLLAAALAMAALGAPSAHAEDLRIGGTGTALGTMRVLGQAFRASRPDVQVQVMPSIGSKGGIRAVVAGSLQLAVSARPASDEEMAAGARSTEYARTPFVFAVARGLPLTAVTTAQLADLYAGRVTQWPDGTPVRLVLRPAGDADSDLVKSISPALREAVTAAEQRRGMTFAVTDQEAADSVERVGGALGTTTLAQMLSERRALRALPIDGQTPDIESAAAGRYPLHKRLHFVTGPQPAPTVQAFIAFVRSPAGRDILRQHGHWIP
ncbi:MAG: hypothetical protein RL456_873 [Pseudomonadota bacterium]|jgi:phosphate transport system substrate-binding protein